MDRLDFSVLERGYRHFVVSLELGEIPDVSSGNDVEDELALELEEPVDNPWTTKGTKFSVLHRIMFSLLFEEFAS